MLVPLGQVVLVPLGQAQPVPICLSQWDRLCLSQLLVPVGQDWCRHHPCKVSPWPCQPKKWGKRYWLMVLACQTCIPKGCMMTPTTRDKNSAWDLHTVCSTFKQSLFSVLSWRHKVDELNSRQNKSMWSSVWSRLSLSFRGNFLVVWTLQHDSILKKIFSQKSLSKNGMTLRNPKKNLRKESW